jgi:uncharacterized protein YfaS (alpha-2-macroglobulin family)
LETKPADRLPGCMSSGRTHGREPHQYLEEYGREIAAGAAGDSVRLKFRAVGRAYVGNVALIDLMPGGFEPVLEAVNAAPTEGTEAAAPAAAPTSKLPGLAGGRSTWDIHYADVREDRVVFYGRVGADFRELSYRIKATNAGRFVVPPAYAESMYERGVEARSAGGQTITVETPGKK